MRLNELERSENLIICNVPLFIRLLEYAREDAKSDVDLHVVAENAIRLGRQLTMNDYASLVNKTESGLQPAAVGDDLGDEFEIPMIVPYTS